ncbi:sensor histidine kinase [Anaeromicropila populeti]|uniref:histidine kinase n=1 Tax=Anaeromicropila populeti TaxID=37658 RepID=A0A1I6KRL6_9FIRM|nr:histidine kinase [Anaeromicropila populeti]SFR93668.1 Signal transduction histidine kinase [Anaeromicropila populeti]
MDKIIDKVILLLCTTVLCIFSVGNEYLIIPVIISLLVSALCIFFERSEIHLVLYLLFTGLCSVYPLLCIFLPLIVYDLFFTRYQYFILFVIPLLIVKSALNNSSLSTLIIMFCLLSYFMKFKTTRYQKLLSAYHGVMDDRNELAIIQEEKNRSILENQDYEISVATLNERNRISKEIHDHVGHLLSRSLIQIGALLTISREPVIKEELSALKESISEGMDSIRASIHNMHDESVDLYATLEKLVRDFQFCPVQFEYNITTTPLLKMKYCFIAITKEAFSNIIKHSDATQVSLQLKEHPAMYQLIISDNGTVSEKTKAIIRRFQLAENSLDGMGLQNMADRVKGFSGNLNLTIEQGFKIYVTIPKELVREEY